MTEITVPRIALIHALEESVVPARAGFATHWPQAKIFDLLDTSLAPDLASKGELTQPMIDRFLTLGRYAAGEGRSEWKADGILFTCSAFGPAIEAVKHDLDIPVYKPNEAAFSRAIALGKRIGLIVTFSPSLPALSEELRQMAKANGRDIEIHGVVAQGALAALKLGEAEEHDRLIDEAARTLPDVDVILLGQFSAARAAPAIQRWSSSPVLTTPACAVEELKAAVADAGITVSAS